MNISKENKIFRHVPELAPELYGLSSDASYNPRGLVAGCEGSYSLQQLQDILKEKYCGHIGVEFSYLPVNFSYLFLVFKVFIITFLGTSAP